MLQWTEKCLLNSIITKTGKWMKINDQGKETKSWYIGLTFINRFKNDIPVSVTL